MEMMLRKIAFLSLSLGGSQKWTQSEVGNMALILINIDWFNFN